MDKISTERRSANMAAIKGKNTSPEMIVRRYLHRQGLRFRLHTAYLPGKPDLVFPSKRSVVFVHGCFWHGCLNCVDGTRSVKSNSVYWTDKIKGNRERDARHVNTLKAAGWKVQTIWECELKSAPKLRRLAAQIKKAPRRRVARQRAVGDE